MKNKKLIFIILTIIILIVIFLIIFYKKQAKKSEIGNNSSSQEIVDYILNISSYEAEVEIEVTSNKNSNKYIIRQQYVKPNKSIQEILQPENLNGIKIIKNDKELKIENSKLDLNKMWNGYEYVTDNCLDLNSFIEEYKANPSSSYEEKDEQIIMSLEKENSKYTKYRSLYIDRKTGKPLKMEIKDDGKKLKIYILYKEVRLNNLEENIIAFNRNYNKQI